LRRPAISGGGVMVSTKRSCRVGSCPRDTLLQALGVPPRVVMDILGHTALSMTMERYAKALPATRRDAAERGGC